MLILSLGLFTGLLSFSRALSCTDPPQTPLGWSVILLADSASFSPRLRSRIYMTLLIVCSSNRVSLEPAVCQKLRTNSLPSLPLCVLLSDRAGRSSPQPDQHDKALAGAEPLGTTRSLPPWSTPRPSTWLQQKCAAELPSQRYSADLSSPTLASTSDPGVSPTAAPVGEACCPPRPPHQIHGAYG